jgi:hypothetical protein
MQLVGIIELNSAPNYSSAPQLPLAPVGSFAVPVFICLPIPGSKDLAHRQAQKTRVPAGPLAYWAVTTTSSIQMFSPASR